MRDFNECIRRVEDDQAQDYEKKNHKGTILEPIILTIFPDNKDYSDDEDEYNNEDLLFLWTYDRHDICLNLNFVCYIDTI